MLPKIILNVLLEFQLFLKVVESSSKRVIAIATIISRSYFVRPENILHIRKKSSSIIKKYLLPKYEIELQTLYARYGCYHLQLYHFELFGNSYQNMKSVVIPSRIKNGST